MLSENWKENPLLGHCSLFESTVSRWHFAARRDSELLFFWRRGCDAVPSGPLCTPYIFFRPRSSPSPQLRYSTSGQKAHVRLAKLKEYMLICGTSGTILAGQGEHIYLGTWRDTEKIKEKRGNKFANPWRTVIKNVLKYFGTSIITIKSGKEYLKKKDNNNLRFVKII